MPYGDHRGVRAFDLISCFQGELRWGPVVVTHRSERVVRQFGYIQTIPPLPMGVNLSFKDIDDGWMHYLDHLAAGGTNLSCAWPVFTRLHGLVLRDLSSVHHSQIGN